MEPRVRESYSPPEEKSAQVFVEDLNREARKLVDVFNVQSPHGGKKIELGVGSDSLKLLIDVLTFKVATP